MTSARDVIESYFMRQVFGLHEQCCDSCDENGCCTKVCNEYDIDVVGHTTEFLSALDAAGFKVIHISELSGFIRSLGAVVQANDRP